MLSSHILVEQALTCPPDGLESAFDLLRARHTDAFECFARQLDVMSANGTSLADRTIEAQRQFELATRRLLEEIG